MIVLVIGHTGTNAYIGTIRTGTGKKSKVIPGMHELAGTSEQEIFEKAAACLKPSLVRKHRGLCIEVRDDPFV